MIMQAEQAKKYRITARMKCAVVNYAEPASKTFNNWLQSLIGANYSYLYAQRNGWKLLEKPHIIALIDDYKAKTRVKSNVDIEFIRNEHLRLAKVAEEKGDLVNATRNLEGLGRTVAAYTDNIKTKDETVPVLSDDEAKVYKEAAEDIKRKLSIKAIGDSEVKTA